jgi:TRAP-type C4-dicarboxylate transport system permease small subunit
VTDETAHPVSRIQRTLAFVIGGLVVISVLAIVAIIAGTWLGAGAAQGSGEGLWPAVFFVPLLALPAAFLLMIALLLVSMLGRRRHNHESQL